MTMFIWETIADLVYLICMSPNDNLLSSVGTVVFQELWIYIIYKYKLPLTLEIYSPRELEFGKRKLVYCLFAKGDKE